MFSDTCDIVPGITGGTCKDTKRHILYIDNSREIIITIIMEYPINALWTGST